MINIVILQHLIEVKRDRTWRKPIQGKYQQEINFTNSLNADILSTVEANHYLQSRSLQHI